MKQAMTPQLPYLHVGSNAQQRGMGEGIGARDAYDYLREEGCRQLEKRGVQEWQLPGPREGSSAELRSFCSVDLDYGLPYL